MSPQILELLVGAKVFDGLSWHIYDENGVELTHPDGVRGLGKVGAHIMWPHGRRSVEIKGGIGHGGKKKKKRWIERDDKIIIFESEEDAIEFIEKEKSHSVKTQSKTRKNKQSRIEVISKQEINSLSRAYNYQRKLYHADQIGDIDSIIAIYKELQEREEDDIEMILIGAL